MKQWELILEVLFTGILQKIVSLVDEPLPTYGVPSEISLCGVWSVRVTDLLNWEFDVPQLPILLPINTEPLFVIDETDELELDVHESELFEPSLLLLQDI